MASPKELAVATDQLRADFQASLETLGNEHERRCKDDPTMYRMFCLGVMMCVQSLKGFAEDPDTALLPHMSAEDSCGAYFDAARSVFHAN